MQSSASSYPATLAFDPPEKVANWRPLVQWLLAIPHFVILYGLGIASEVIAVISWFAILFTGKIPPGLANFQAMYLRYSTRTALYSGFLKEEYPPFSFTNTTADPGDDPRVRVDLNVQYENRNRLTTAFRIILVIPHILFGALLFIGAFFAWLVAFFAVLFTGKWPGGLRDFVVNVFRFWLRLQAYLLLLNDQYPPFSIS